MYVVSLPSVKSGCTSAYFPSGYISCARKAYRGIPTPCQRVSDYNNISPDSFTTTAKGTPIIRLVQQKTHTEVKIPIMNPNLQAICEKYNYNLPSVVDVILNRYIKEILKELSETVPSLTAKVHTKLTMKQRKQEADGKINVERNSKGEVMMPRYNCVYAYSPS